MRKVKHTYSKRLKFSIAGLLLAGALAGCEQLGLGGKSTEPEETREVVARVHDTYLYRDELAGIVSAGVTKEDSTARIEGYVNSWIRKQLLIQEAKRKININEAEVERKILDYRYSLIAYEYQTYIVKQQLDTIVSADEIREYYAGNIDNFILKQNIVRATFIKVPKTAPKTNKIKEMMFTRNEKDEKELKSYCLSFSAAYHISDSSWMVFDELVKSSPLTEIPNKIQFLKSNPYYETSDDNYLYFLKVEEYRISDNVSPMEFVKDEIRNIILNKRKVEIAKQLEDEVYKKAEESSEFEIIRQ